MLDMGFAEDLDAILEATPDGRGRRRSSRRRCRRASWRSRSATCKNPARVTIAREKTAAGKMPRVRQVAYVVPRAHKPAALERVLDMENPTSAIVFCRTRLEVETLVETLNAHGYRAEALHGGMEQRQRDRVMQQLPRRQASTSSSPPTSPPAASTSQQLSHVVNYDVPVGAGGLRPPHRPDRPRRTRRAPRSRSPSRASTGCCAASKRSPKQKIEVATVPTVADLRARRLELTRASLRERILAGGLDDVRRGRRVAGGGVRHRRHRRRGGEAGARGAGGDGDGIATSPDADLRRGPRRRPRRRTGARRRRPASAARRDERVDAAVRRRRPAGRHPARRSGRRDYRRSGHRLARARRDRNRRPLFAGRGARRRCADTIIAALRATTIRGKKVPVRRDRDN